MVCWLITSYYWQDFPYKYTNAKSKLNLLKDLFTKKINLFRINEIGDILLNAWIKKPNMKNIKCCYSKI